MGFLLTKYGAATDDYFKESSYKKTLKSKGKIKSITKGNTTRSSEGLYCHHIDENKHQSLSSALRLISSDLPFEYQKKERLVYSDLIEHAILHALISKEYPYPLGIEGYEQLSGTINQWYVEKRLPKKEWEINCYNKSFLEISEATELIEYIERTIIKKEVRERKEKEKQRLIDMIGNRYPYLKEKGVNQYSSRQELLINLYELCYEKKCSKDEYYELKKETSNNKLWNEFFEEVHDRQIVVDIARWEKEKKEQLIREEMWKKEQEILEEKQAREYEIYLEQFKEHYPRLDSMGIYPHTITRQKILNGLYDLKYKNKYSKKELKSKKINTVSDDLFEELKRLSNEI